MGATRVLPSGVDVTGFGIPSTPTPLVPPAPSGDGGDDDGRVPLYRSLGAKIGAGILVAAAIGAGVYVAFLQPEPITLAPHVSVITLPTPTIEATFLPSPTDFVAALPPATLTYALTDVEEAANTQRAVWPARYAEAWYLTYGDGSGATMTVDAYQHYSEEAATAAFESLWAEQEAIAGAEAGIAPSPDPAASPNPSDSPDGADLAERHPVMSGEVQVGESFQFSAQITEGEEGAETTRDVAIIVWRNLTGVFIMTADPATIGDLFLEYGI